MQKVQKTEYMIRLTNLMFNLSSQRYCPNFITWYEFHKKLSFFILIDFIF